VFSINQVHGNCFVELLKVDEKSPSMGLQFTSPAKNAFEDFVY
jgi:hypothetical protein